MVDCQVALALDQVLCYLGESVVIIQMFRSGRSVAMTSNERFARIMHHQPVDHVLDMEFGYWEENHVLWQREGFPAEASVWGDPAAHYQLESHFLPDDAAMRNERMELYFGLERRYRPPVNTILEPKFEIEEAGERDGYRYYHDADHVLCRVLADGCTSMPEHIEYPLKSRADWERLFKPRLDPESPGRFPENLGAHMDFILEKNYVPWLYVGSLFGLLRNYVGFQEMCYMIHDDPVLVDEIVQHMADTACAVLEKTLPDLKGKALIGHFWEDICFNAGPMISPAFFRERIVPRYRQITGLLAEYGIDSIIVDCDGFIEPLVQCWLDAGINIMFPLERASNTDPARLREKFGRQLLMLGGVDKRCIAAGGDDIVRHLETLAPLVEDGGYIPHCDHLCPADVSFENYCFYLEKKREIFGIPKKELCLRSYPDNIK